MIFAGNARSSPAWETPTGPRYSARAGPIASRAITGATVYADNGMHCMGMSVDSLALRGVRLPHLPHLGPGGGPAGPPPAPSPAGPEKTGHVG